MTPDQVEEIIADLCSNPALKFSQREAVRRLLSERNKLRAKREAVPALTRYDAERDTELDQEPPLERLRFFLSLALSPQDWIDVEPFLDAVRDEAKREAADIPPFLRRNPEDAPEGKRLCECGQSYVAKREAVAVPEVISKHFDEAVESARLLGSTQANKAFGCYTEQDSRFEVAMHETIAMHRRAMLAASQPAQQEKGEGR